MKKKQLVYVTFRYPWPLITGDRIRCFNILKALSKEYSVDLVVLDAKAGDKNNVLEEWCNQVFAMAPPNILQIFVQVFFGILRGWSLQESLFYRPKLNSILKNKHYDVGFIHLLRSQRNMKFVNTSKFVLDMCDPVSLTYRQLFSNTSWLEPWKYISAFEYLRSKKNETKSIDAFDKVFLHTYRDAKTAKLNSTKVIISTMGVPTDHLTPRFNKSDKLRKLVFVGNLDYLPNKLGLHWFLEEVFPELPDEFSLEIVGAGGNDLKARFADDNVRFHGRVDSLEKYFSSCGIGIAPLFVASGIQNKAIEYIYSGLPVVSSLPVKQALDDDCNQTVLGLKQDTQEWVHAICNIEYDPNLCQRTSKIIAKKHDWNRISASLIEEIKND